MWKNDIMHGEGKFTTKNETYEGIWENGIINSIKF